MILFTIKIGISKGSSIWTGCFLFLVIVSCVRSRVELVAECLADQNDMDTVGCVASAGNDRVAAHAVR